MFRSVVLLGLTSSVAIAAKAFPNAAVEEVNAAGDLRRDLMPPIPPESKGSDDYLFKAPQNKARDGPNPVQPAPAPTSPVSSTPQLWALGRTTVYSLVHSTTVVTEKANTSTITHYQTPSYSIAGTLTGAGKSFLPSAAPTGVSQEFDPSNLANYDLDFALVKARFPYGLGKHHTYYYIVKMAGPGHIATDPKTGVTFKDYQPAVFGDYPWCEAVMDSNTNKMFYRFDRVRGGKHGPGFSAPFRIAELRNCVYSMLTHEDGGPAELRCDQFNTISCPSTVGPDHRMRKCPSSGGTIEVLTTCELRADKWIRSEMGDLLSGIDTANNPADKMSGKKADVH